MTYLFKIPYMNAPTVNINNNENSNIPKMIIAKFDIIIYVNTNTIPESHSFVKVFSMLMFQIHLVREMFNQPLINGSNNNIEPNMYNNDSNRFVNTKLIIVDNRYNHVNVNTNIAPCNHNLTMFIPIILYQTFCNFAKQPEP